MLFAERIVEPMHLATSPVAGECPASAGREVLTSEEEVQLAGLIALGDTQARNRLIQSNLRLVTKIAREFSGRGLSLDDLIGEGNLGLISAAERFDPRFGTRFSTYARIRIKEAIQSALMNTAPTIRVPAHMVKLLIKWRRAERALYGKTGRFPSADEVALLLGLTEQQTELLLKARHASRVRLEGTATSDTVYESASESVLRHERPGAAIEADEEWNRLVTKMKRLNARERMILSLRFGLGEEPPLTLQQIAQRLGLNKEWVRKITTKAIQKLEDGRESRPITACCAIKRTHSYDFDRRSRPFLETGSYPRSAKESHRRQPPEPAHARVSPHGRFRSEG